MALENPLTHGAHGSFLGGSHFLRTRTGRGSTVDSLNSFVTLAVESPRRTRSTRGNRLLGSRLEMTMTIHLEYRYVRIWEVGEQQLTLTPPRAPLRESLLRTPAARSCPLVGQFMLPPRACPKPVRGPASSSSATALPSRRELFWDPP